MQKFEQLEHELVPFCGRPGVVACSSGTAALHLALEVARHRRLLKEGDLVAVPSFAMVAVARAVTLAGMTPLFVDVDPVTLNLQPGLLEAACHRESVRAVIAVHTYGRPADMASISGVAADNGLLVIEDCAEAHGIHPHPFTYAACWSFYQNKTVGGEEGGCLAFTQSALTGTLEDPATVARSLRSLGFVDNPHRPQTYQHLPRGHNYRMSNAHAGLVLEALGVIDVVRSVQRVTIDRYDDVLRSIGLTPLPPRAHPWVYDLRLPGRTRRDLERVVLDLNRGGVAARLGFQPLHLQREYARFGVRLDTSELASHEVLYLPIHPRVMTDETFGLVRKALAPLA